MIEVWLMLVLHCTGHLNAQCVPHVVEYPSKQACEDARPRTTRSPYGVCFPTARIATTPKEMIQ
jgi:hypothetical protein